MSFVAKEREIKKEVPNQDKQTPHTILQNVSPKTLRTLLTPKGRISALYLQKNKMLPIHLWMSKAPLIPSRYIFYRADP